MIVYAAGSWHYSTMNEGYRETIDGLLKPYNVTAEQCAESYQHRLTVNFETFKQLGSLAPKRFLPPEGTLEF